MGTSYVSGYSGHDVNRVEPAPGSRVLAELLEFTGDLTDGSTATVTTLGPGIVVTERTAYVANQVFELIGGMLQAHLNVEAVRHWSNPTHWGDTLLFFMRRVLLDLGLAPLWQTRLRSFGTYDGVLSFRHDVHGMLDFTMLDYQVQNLIPASYDIEDPAFSTNITEPMAAEWVKRTTQNNFIEPALHNDSSIGDPPTGVYGKGLFEHVSNAGKNLGFMVCTCGRHSGGHMHPETIDAMDYLYAHDENILGLCTFCYYHMIEYGVRHPDVMAGEGIGGKPLTLHHRRAPHHLHAGCLVSVPPGRHDRRRVAPAARLGPHARVRRRLRAGRGDLRRPRRAPSRHRRPAGERRLQLPVPPGARARPVAERRQGHARLCALRHQPRRAEEFLDSQPARALPAHGRLRGPCVSHKDGGREVTVANPSARRIAGMVVEQRLPFGSVWDGAQELVHVAHDAFVTVPPLAPGAEVTLRFKPEGAEAPIVRQPSNKGLEILDARHDPATGETRITVRVCRAQPLRVEGVDPEGVYRVEMDGEAPRNVAVRTTITIQRKLGKAAARPEVKSLRARTPGITRFLDLMIEGDANNFIERTIRIHRLPAAEEKPARLAILAAIPKKTGRVT